MGKSITDLSSVTTVGLDLAKHVFQVHGVDASGRVVVAKAIRRNKLLEFFASLPPCLVGLEACGSAHHWARELVVLGASNWSGRLQGGAIEGWYAPNITSDGREGVGNWSTEQIANFLRTGASPGRGVAVGPMADTVQHSLSHLSDEDVAAIAAYLKSVPAEESYRAAEYGGFNSPNAGGGATYLTHCASCHLPDGKGIAGEIPALQGNGAVLAKGPENIIRVVLGELPASNGLAPMPAAGAGMTDEDVVAAIDYVRQSWGNAAPVSEGPGMVAKLRAQTRTLLAANLLGGCPAVADTGLAKAIEQSKRRGTIESDEGRRRSQ